MVLVAIQSVHFPNNYVGLDGRGVDKFLPAGGGKSFVQTYIGTWETYTLVENSDGTVSFKSTVFNNVFLRLEAKGVTPGHLLPPGGGVVNAQFTAQSLEKFKIHKKDDPAGKYQGVVGIESAATPGTYLRLEGKSGETKVNVQGVFKTLEEFKILVVGK